VKSLLQPENYGRYDSSIQESSQSYFVLVPVISKVLSVTILVIGMVLKRCAHVWDRMIAIIAMAKDMACALR
jgi:hypothetical protein